MKTKLWACFNIVAGLASILGVLFLFLTDRQIGVVALCSFCFFLLCALITTWIGIFRFVRKEHPEEYRKISAFTSFETSDGIHGVYEVFKVIQSKRFILQQIDHNFKWSGTKIPEISSELQTIKQFQQSDLNNYDKATLLLNKPLGYNETATIHFKALTDDFDGKSLPYLDYKVSEKMDVIHFRITLKNKDDHFSKSARLLKKPVKSEVPTDYIQYGSVPFDCQSKSYQYYLTDPEIGYYYRLEWEK